MKRSAMPRIDVLRRRSEGPPRAQGEGQGGPRGDQFPALGRPQLQVLPNRPGEPHQGLRAQWVGNDTLRIDVPKSRLPKVRSEKYVASMFPNSQAAGLLKTDGETLKKICRTITSACCCHPQAAPGDTPAKRRNWNRRPTISSGSTPVSIGAGPALPGLLPSRKTRANRSSCT